MTTQPALLELSGIERVFALGQTRIHALRGIDLRIQAGEFMAIWGPSGSGKSTLLHMLGLIDTPDKGTLRFDGQDVPELSDDALSDWISAFSDVVNAVVKEQSAEFAKSGK